MDDRAYTGSSCLLYFHAQWTPSVRKQRAMRRFGRIKIKRRASNLDDYRAVKAVRKEDGGNPKRVSGLSRSGTGIYQAVL